MNHFFNKNIRHKSLFILYLTILNCFFNLIISNSKKYYNQKKVLKKKFKKDINFIKSCLNDKKIKSFERFDKPKISLIIPFYNGEKYLTRLLRSIQMQELKEIEIIFVEDCSTDNGLELLEKYSKIDKRIKIIKNKRNEGCFYSYARGIIEAKANHTMFLDDDDMLLSHLKELYEISYNNNKDINDFGFIQGRLIDFDQLMRKDEILYQPNIGEMIFTNNYIGCTFIVNKIFKTDLIKNAIKLLKKEYFDSHIILHCDTFLFIHFFYFAKSYQSFSNLFGYYHIFNNATASGNINDKYNQLFKDTLLLVDYISEMKFSSKIIYNGHIKFAIDLLNWPIKICGEKRLEIDWKNINKVLKKILTNRNLNRNNTLKINSLIQSLKEKDINITNTKIS